MQITWCQQTIEALKEYGFSHVTEGEDNTVHVEFTDGWHTQDEARAVAFMASVSIRYVLGLPIDTPRCTHWAFPHKGFWYPMVEIYEK